MKLETVLIFAVGFIVWFRLLPADYFFSISKNFFKASDFNKSMTLPQVLPPVKALTKTLVSTTTFFIKFLTNLIANPEDFLLGNFVFPDIPSQFFYRRIEFFSRKIINKFFSVLFGHLPDNLFNLSGFYFNSYLWHKIITSTRRKVYKKTADTVKGNREFFRRGSPP